MGREAKVVDLSLFVIHETEKAYLVSEKPERPKDEPIWLPKYACEIGEQTGMAGGFFQHDFQVDYSMALEKKLI